MVEIIRTLVAQNGITLKSLEKEIGIGNGTIRKWNQSHPRIDTLQKVADYFGVSIDYLVGRTNTPEINE